jgi:hypothetical protein
MAARDPAISAWLPKADYRFKLSAIGLIAALRTLQLVDARDGNSRPATVVVDAALIETAAAMAAGFAVARLGAAATRPRTEDDHAADGAA